MCGRRQPHCTSARCATRAYVNGERLRAIAVGDCGRSAEAARNRWRSAETRTPVRVSCEHGLIGRRYSHWQSKNPVGSQSRGRHYTHPESVGGVEQIQLWVAARVAMNDDLISRTAITS